MDCPGLSSNTYGMLLLGHLWRANDETARRCLSDVTGAGLMSPSIMVLSTSKYENTEAAVQRCSEEKVLWKHAANLQENTHAEVWFQ